MKTLRKSIAEKEECKMINISLHLYGKPEWDLPVDDGVIDGDLLRAHGNELKEHLLKVADIFEKLKKNGWNGSLASYSLELYKEDITKQEAEKELKRLGISLKDINIMDFEDEE